MPLYDYDCAACGRRFEVVHGVHVEGPTICPICGSGPIRKAISAPAVHFKGSGWAKKERRATPATATSKGSGDGDSSDGGSSDGGSSDGGSSDGGSSDGSSEAAAKADRATDASSSGSKAAASAKPVETGSAAKGD